MVYKKTTLDITQKQLENAANGKQITLSANQLKGNTHSLHIHPSSYEKIMKAKRAGKGCRIHISHGEIQHDLNQGGSIWSWFKDKLWPAIKPAVSAGLDAAVVPLSEAAGPYAPAVAIGRKAIKSLTGLGVPVKGSQEAKDKMAALRAKKKAKGGSFVLS